MGSKNDLLGQSDRFPSEFNRKTGQGGLSMTDSSTSSQRINYLQRNKKNCPKVHES